MGAPGGAAAVGIVVLQSLQGRCDPAVKPSVLSPSAANTLKCGGGEAVV